MVPFPASLRKSPRRPNAEGEKGTLTSGEIGEKLFDAFAQLGRCIVEFGVDRSGILFGSLHGHVTIFLEINFIADNAQNDVVA